MTNRRLDVKLRVLGRRTRRVAWRVLKQHYVTLGSVAIIGALFALVMTSDSFASRKDRATLQGPAAQQETSQYWPRGPHRSMLFYVVENQQQLTAVSQLVNGDLEGRAAVDRVVYLIAGTREEEAATISRLNIEAQFIQGTNVDMRIVDMRGRFGR